MPKPKIDRVKLDQMLRSGKSQTEVAQLFGVSAGAVSKAKGELRTAVVRNAAVESAHKVLAHHLDVMGQLNKINRDANELLDLMMRWNRGDDDALQILESQVRKLKARGVKNYHFKDPRELALKAMQEIRGQLSLQHELLKTLIDAQVLADFQQEMLQAIEEESPETRERIVTRLQTKLMLRGVVHFQNKGGITDEAKTE